MKPEMYKVELKVNGHNVRAVFIEQGDSWFAQCLEIRRVWGRGLTLETALENLKQTLERKTPKGGTLVGMEVAGTAYFEFYQKAEPFPERQLTGGS